MEPARKASRLGALFRNKDMRRIAFWAALVMLAAGVILVVSAFPRLKKTSPPPPVGITSPSQDYDRAVAAAASGDMTTAVTMMSGVVKSEPNNVAARERLAEFEKVAGKSTVSSSAGSKTGSKTGSKDTSPSVAISDAAYLRAIDDLTDLLPASMRGYRVFPAEDQGKLAVTTAEPVGGGAASGKLTVVELLVHDEGSAKAAAKFTRRVSKKVYSKNTDANAKVGLFTGYYGTDGRRVATVVFARGRYVFELIATAATANANTYKSLCISAAAEFPASRK